MSRRVTAALAILIGAVGLLTSAAVPTAPAASTESVTQSVPHDPALAERTALRMTGEALGLYDLSAEDGVTEEEAHRLATIIGIEDLRLVDDLDSWGFVPHAQPTTVYIWRPVLTVTTQRELVGLLAHEHAHSLGELHGLPEDTALLEDGITDSLAAYDPHPRQHEAVASCLDDIIPPDYRSAPCTLAQHLAVWEWADSLGAHAVSAVIASRYIGPDGPLTLDELRETVRITQPDSSPRIDNEKENTP